MPRSATQEGLGVSPLTSPGLLLSRVWGGGVSKWGHPRAPLTFTSLPRFQGQDLSSMFSIPATIPTYLLPGLSAAWLPVRWRSNGPLSEGRYSPGVTSFLPLAPGSRPCTVLLAFPNSEFHDTVSPCHSSLGQGSRFHPIYRMRHFRPGSHNGLCFLSSFFFIL